MEGGGGGGGLSEGRQQINVLSVCAGAPLLFCVSLPVFMGHLKAFKCTAVCGLQVLPQPPLTRASRQYWLMVKINSADTEEGGLLTFLGEDFSMYFYLTDNKYVGSLTSSRCLYFHVIISATLNKYFLAFKLLLGF